MSVPPETMEQQLLQGLFQQEPDNEDRLRALRRQGAIGTLATMGGANLAPMGQGMVQSAASERKDMDTQRNQGLARAVTQIQGLKGLKDLNAREDDEWVYKADPVHGGIIAIRKDDPSIVRRISGAGAPGEGGQLVSQDNPYGLSAKNSKKPRDDALRAGYNLDRIIGDYDEIMNATAESARAARPGLVEQLARGQGWTTLAGVISSDERQVVNAAQRDLLDAALWMATGAAYNKEQLEGLSESLLPRWEDGEKSLASKRRRAGYQIQAAFRRAEEARTPQDLEVATQLLDKIYAPFNAAQAASTGGTTAGGNGTTAATAIKLD